MDKEYWEKYYSAQGPTKEPSSFARYVVENYKSTCGHVFDIGCGNGRDTIYFSSQSIPITGIDQCQIAIRKNQIDNEELGLDASFQEADFSAFDYDKIASEGYSIYSRFTLHAINNSEEENLFSHINSGKNIRYLFIEVRSTNDSLYGQGEEVGRHEFVTTHYRRFIDSEDLKSKLSENFSIEYFEESCGFAKTEMEDPCLIRVVAKRR